VSRLFLWTWWTWWTWWTDRTDGTDGTDGGLLTWGGMGMNGFDSAMWAADVSFFAEVASPCWRVANTPEAEVLRGVLQPGDQGMLPTMGGNAPMGSRRLDAMLSDVRRLAVDSGSRIEVLEGPAEGTVPGVGPKWRAWRVDMLRDMGATVALFLMPSSGRQPGADEW
jgi:hypothetical protein